MFLVHRKTFVLGSYMKMKLLNCKAWLDSTRSSIIKLTGPPAMRVLISVHPLCHQVSYGFWVLLRDGCEMYLTVASVAFSCYLWGCRAFYIHIYFWVSSWNCLFLAFVHFPIFPSLICEGSLYIMDTNILLQVVSLRLWFVFHFVCNIFYCIQIFFVYTKMYPCLPLWFMVFFLFRKFFPLQCHKQVFLYLFLKVSRFCNLLLVFHPPIINFLYDVRDLIL